MLFMQRGNSRILDRVAFELRSLPVDPKREVLDVVAQANADERMRQ